MDSGSDSDDSSSFAVRQVAVARDIGDTLLEARFGGAVAESSDTVAATAAATLEGDTASPVSPEIISCEPDITYTALNPQDRIVMLASDGIWEFLGGILEY